MFVVTKTHKSVVNIKFSFTIAHRECLCALNVAMRYSPKRWQQNTCSKNRGQQTLGKKIIIMKRADKCLVLVLTGESISVLTEIVFL